jgi:hypothetical protein
MEKHLMLRGSVSENVLDFEHGISSSGDVPGLNCDGRIILVTVVRREVCG